MSGPPQLKSRHRGTGVVTRVLTVKTASAESPVSAMAIALT